MAFIITSERYKFWGLDHRRWLHLLDILKNLRIYCPLSFDEKKKLLILKIVNHRRLNVLGTILISLCTLDFHHCTGLSIASNSSRVLAWPVLTWNCPVWLWASCHLSGMAVRMKIFWTFWNWKFPISKVHFYVINHFPISIEMTLW